MDGRDDLDMTGGIKLDAAPKGFVKALLMQKQ